MLRDRLPPNLARHAAVALALVTESLSTERDLAELRAAERERGRFVSTVAHELRTPLTGLGGYLDLILDGQVDDPAVQREFLERGQSIVGSMNVLVGDLLEMSRLEAGSIDLLSEPFSVADALGAVADGLMPIALDRGVHLDTTLPPRTPSSTGPTGASSSSPVASRARTRSSRSAMRAPGSTRRIGRGSSSRSIASPIIAG
jgi:signal transduction histidine kinase